MIKDSPVCINCINYDNFDMSKNSCKAFPDGIPKKIWENNNDHSKAIGGEKKDKNGNIILFKSNI